MSNTLFITEGSKDESRFIKKIWKLFREESVVVYSYCTNIHVLMNDLFGCGKLDEDIDILRHLSSKEKNEEEKKKLNMPFTDVFLIFDMDPQDKENDTEKLRSMLGFFNDSSNNGKLLINYPMFESYRHVLSLEDDAFGERIVCAPHFKEYKQIVERDCCPELKQTGKYDRDIFEKLALMHIRKANYMLSGKYDLPSAEQFKRWDGTDILDVQQSEIGRRNCIHVLNTSIFIIVDYRPSDYLPPD